MLVYMCLIGLKCYVNILLFSYCRYSGVWLITRCGSLIRSGYDIKDWGLCIFVLVVYGVVFRCIAFFCMITFQKN